MRPMAQIQPTTARILQTMQTKIAVRTQVRTQAKTRATIPAKMQAVMPAKTPARTAAVMQAGIVQTVTD